MIMSTAERYQMFMDMHSARTTARAKEMAKYSPNAESLIPAIEEAERIQHKAKETAFEIMERLCK